MLSHPPLCSRTGNYHKSPSPKLLTNSPTPIRIMITTNVPTIFSTRAKHLHACALISKNWTGRSQAHLFREANGDEEGPFATSLDSLVPYIEKLKIQLPESQHYWLFPFSDLLAPLQIAPITYLAITGGVLTTGARVCLVERVVSLFAILHDGCLLSLHLILDIMLAHPGLKRLHPLCYSIGPARPVPL